MKTELEKYKQYERNIKFILKGCGIWSQSNANVQRLLAYIGVFSLCGCFIGAYNATSYGISDIMLVTRLLALQFSLGNSCMKVSRGEYILAGPQRWSFDYESGGISFWLLHLMTTSATYYVWAATCGVDAMFGLYILKICGLLRLLASEFENLGMAKDYQATLTACMKRHKMFMRTKATLEKVYGFLTIWLTVTSAISQCTLVFQMSQVLKNFDVAEIAYLISFIILKLTQAFTYAWYGSLVEDESTRCLNSIYNTAWSGSGNSRLMKDVLVILLQKPMVITAKDCMPVKMEIFAKIVNTSVSYFFLLQALGEDMNG